MARKVKTVVVPHEGRDKGKRFVITEMSAAAAEKWAARALSAMARAGVDVPDEAMAAGAAVLIATGVRSFAGMPFEDAEPLLDEMMSCVQVQPDPGNPHVLRALFDDDTEEVATRLWLRGEVVEIHTGFSVTGALSTLGARVKETDENTTATPTFPKSLGPS